MATVQQLAFSIIRVFEGLKLQAYQDRGGVWTIGFGHTKTAKPGMMITEAQALDLFRQDAEPLFEIVKGKPTLEAAALVSFGFNCGAGALKKLMAGEIRIEPDHDADDPWASVYGIRAAGKQERLPGLMARRDLESMLIAEGKKREADIQRLLGMIDPPRG